MQGSSGGWRGAEDLICLFSRVWLVRVLPGLACLVYIATYVVLYAKRKNTNSDTVDTYSIAELEQSGIHILEASCVPSSDIACRLRQLRGIASNHELHYLLEYAIGRISEYTEYVCRYHTAHALLCWCIQSTLWRVGSRRRWG